MQYNHQNVDSFKDTWDTYDCRIACMCILIAFIIRLILDCVYYSITRLYFCQASAWHGTSGLDVTVSVFN